MLHKCASALDYFSEEGEVTGDISLKTRNIVFQRWSSPFLVISVVTSRQQFYGWFTFIGCSVEGCRGKIGLQARVEIFYFGCCPYSYFFAYGGSFLDETWTRTGDDFKAELERFGVEVVEYNMLEHPELVKKLNLQIDPYNPFFSLARSFIDNKEVTKDEFFKKIRETREIKEDEDRD